MKGRIALIIVAGLLVALAIPFFGKQQEVHGQKEEKQQQWEYRVLAPQIGANTDPGTLAGAFNGLGAEGWECVGPVHVRDGLPGVKVPLVVFKRPKK